MLKYLDDQILDKKIGQTAESQRHEVTQRLSVMLRASVVQKKH